MPPKKATIQASSGNVMRIAFALEGAANIGSAAVALANPGFVYGLIAPDKTIDILKKHPASISDTPDPAAVLMIQWIGSLVCALTVPLALGALDNPYMAVTRKMTYYTLGAGEAFLIPVMLWQLAFSDVKDAPTTRNFLITAIFNLAPLLLWRIFVITQKPQWFGDVGLVNLGSTRTKYRSL